VAPPFYFAYYPASGDGRIGHFDGISVAATIDPTGTEDYNAGGCDADGNVYLKASSVSTYDHLTYRYDPDLTNETPFGPADDPVNLRWIGPHNAANYDLFFFSSAGVAWDSTRGWLWFQTTFNRTPTVTDDVYSLAAFDTAGVLQTMRIFDSSTQNPFNNKGFGFTYDSARDRLWMVVSGALWSYDIATDTFDDGGLTLAPFGGVSDVAYQQSTDTLWLAHNDTQDPIKGFDPDSLVTPIHEIDVVDWLSDNGPYSIDRLAISTDQAYVIFAGEGGDETGFEDGIYSVPVTSTDRTGMELHVDGSAYGGLNNMFWRLWTAPPSTNFGVLKGMNLDETLAWFDRPLVADSGRYKFEDDTGTMWVQQFPYHEVVPDTTRTLKAMNDAGEVGTVGWFAPEEDELAFYFTDADTGVYTVQGGAIVASWSGLAAYVAGDGQGNVLAMGQPESGSGPTLQKAQALQLSAADLTVIDPMWGPDEGSNTQYWLEGAKPVTTLNVNFVGAGTVYDPTSGHVLVSQIGRRYTDLTQAVQEIEGQVWHYLPDGTFVKVRAASGGPQDMFLSSASIGNRGVVMLDGKFYFLYGQVSIAEYDPATGTVQAAELTLDGSCLDLAADATGRLWVLSEDSDAGQYYAHSFTPAVVPWGTTGTLTVYADSVRIASDTDASFGFFGSPMAFGVTGDSLLVAGWEWVSGELAFYTVPMTGGAATLVLQDPAHFDCWDIYLP
jgi:hypothetical protein